MLRWSDQAKAAIASFFVKWNDIDVYIEDTAKHVRSLYGVLINRALGDACKVDKIFPLGDRRAVLVACQNDQSKGGRPRLYLIDGDLDLLTGDAVPSLRRLHRHHVYAIENYLVCRKAIAAVLHEEYPEFSEAQIAAKFDYKTFMARCKPLEELFVWFALSKAIAAPLPTLSLGVGFFLTKTQPPRLDDAKVAGFCAARKAQLEKIVGKKKLAGMEKAVRKRYAGFADRIDPIAARDFVFPLIRNFATECGLRLKPSRESLQLRLAKLAELNHRRPFVRAVRAAAR